jgi:hypothetical protein
MEQLNFQWVLFVTNPVLRWLLKFNALKSVTNSLVVESSSIDCGEQNVASSVEQQQR